MSYADPYRLKPLSQPRLESVLWALAILTYGVGLATWNLYLGVFGARPF